MSKLEKMKCNVCFILVCLTFLLSCRFVKAQVADVGVDLAGSLADRGVSAMNLAKQSKDATEQERYFSVARGNFQRFLEEFPNHEKAHQVQYFIARCYYDAGSNDKALAVFEAIVSKQKKGTYVAAAASILAKHAFDAKKFIKAAQLYELLSANATAPVDRVRGIYMQARSLQEGQQPNDAQRCYELVLADQDAAATDYFQPSLRTAAIIQMELGEHQKALSNFNQLAKSTATDAIRAEATLFAGVCAWKVKDYAFAEDLFETILQNNNNDWSALHADALVQILQIHYQSKEYAKVITLHNQYAKDLPQNVRISDLLARSLMQEKRYEEAIAAFSTVQKLNPKDALATDAGYFILLCYQKSNAPDLVAQADHYIAVYGKNAKSTTRIHTAYMIKAAVLHQRNSLTEAAETYRLIKPSLIDQASRANLLFQRGSCLAAIQDAKGAIASLSSFIEEYASEKRYPEALALRGDCYSKIDDSDSALRDFSKLIDLKPDPSLAIYAWQKSAAIQRSRRNYSAMILSYESCIASIPSLPDNTKAEALFFIGYGYSKLEKYQQAVSPLEEARKIAPAKYQETASMILINCHFSLEKLEALFSELDLALNSSHAKKISPAILSWAAAQALSRQLPDAAQRYYFQVANHTNPQNTPKEIWRELAKAMIRNKQHKEALVSLQNYLNQEQNAQGQVSALCEKALCHLKLGDATEAKAALDRVFALKPSGSIKMEAELLLGDYYITQNDVERAQGLFAANVIMSDDPIQKPRALHKLVACLEARKDNEQATKYREQLRSEFPNWKPAE